MDSNNQILCPSAQPHAENSRVIGVMIGSVDKPEMAYLADPQPVTQELLDLAKPLNPDEVFRFSAPCACTGCSHYKAEDSKCHLAEKVVRWVPKVVDQLPTCAIRNDCRWWQQEGREACLRCPQMVTNDLMPTDEMRRAANPEVA